ncbi:MAG: alpha/beta hydrolase [Erysipelotrichaceae bacterium]|nr:alpha/beta hydrolase [Erysipelotrichaceae bacterium]
MLEQTLIRVAEVDSVKTEDFEMRYVHFGNTLGDPVVILPGLSIKSVMESYQAIARQYTIFADNSDVYLFDRREDVPHGYDMDTMAEDTIKAMDVVGIRNAYLLGVSQGGMLAQLIAVKRPDLVKKMVLCSTAANVEPEEENRIKDWMILAQQGRREELAMAFARLVYSPEIVEANSQMFNDMAESFTEDELARFVIMAGATTGFDLREKLKEINCPVLVIAGDSDRIFSVKKAEELAELVKGDLYIYENGSHAVYDEKANFPERVFIYFKHGLWEDMYLNRDKEYKQRGSQLSFP